MDGDGGDKQEHAGELGIVAPTLDRACHLVNELSAGDVVSGCIDLYPNPKPQQTIVADPERIRIRAGVQIPDEAMLEILTKLNFEAEMVDGKIVHSLLG